MQTTNLLALRMPDGRLSFASYKDDEEKERIVAWARDHNAQIDPHPVRPQDVTLNHI